MKPAVFRGRRKLVPVLFLLESPLKLASVLGTFSFSEKVKWVEEERGREGKGRWWRKEKRKEKEEEKEKKKLECI